MLEKEMWRQVAVSGVTPRRFFVSTHGRLLDVKRNLVQGFRAERMRYQSIRLEQAPLRLMHQVVAHAFLGPCPEGLQVNHRNLIKADNRAANLEYVTHKENMAHRAENKYRLREFIYEDMERCKLWEIHPRYTIPETYLRLDPSKPRKSNRRTPRRKLTLAELLGTKEELAKALGA